MPRRAELDHYQLHPHWLYRTCDAGTGHTVNSEILIVSPLLFLCGASSCECFVHKFCYCCRLWREPLILPAYGAFLSLVYNVQWLVRSKRFAGRKIRSNNVVNSETEGLTKDQTTFAALPQDSQYFSILEYVRFVSTLLLLLCSFLACTNVPSATPARRSLGGFVDNLPESEHRRILIHSVEAVFYVRIDPPLNCDVTNLSYFLLSFTHLYYLSSRRGGSPQHAECCHFSSLRCYSSPSSHMRIVTYCHYAPTLCPPSTVRKVGPSGFE